MRNNEIKEWQLCPCYLERYGEFLIYLAEKVKLIEEKEQFNHT